MGTVLLLIVLLLPFAAAPWVYPLRHRDRRLRDRLVRMVPVLELGAVLLFLLFPQAELVLPGVLGLGLSFTGGGLRTLLVLVTAILWLGSGLSSPSYFREGDKASRYYLYWLLTQGALMGVFLAGDFFTLFVCFEMMSFASYVWVAQNETPAALRAAETYLAVAVIGGMALLAGLLLLNAMLGTLRFGEMRAAVLALPPEQKGWLYGAGGLCLVGFGAKAGMFPLHIWLPKAHPAAPAPASALLSGILTKSGVFGVLLLCRELFRTEIPWNAVLLTLAVVTMVLGAVMALFSVDLKRTLACSSMSQIGFILLGAAMQGFLNGENALAALGTVLHMLNHSLIKLLLFLAAGVIYSHTHSLDLNVIRGWGRNKPLLKGFFFCGAASIAGVPGFSGYVSKTLLHESLVEYIHHLEHIGASTALFRGVEWLFLLSGGLTAAYMCKLFWAIFVAHPAMDRHLYVRDYFSWGTLWTLALSALALIVLGLTPSWTMEPLGTWAVSTLEADPLAHGVHYFAWVNLKGALISLGIGALVYLFVVRRFLMAGTASEPRYLDRWPSWLDLEERVYRPLIGGLSFAGAFCARTLGSLGDWVIGLGERLLFVRARGVITPRRDEDFGSYDRRSIRSFLGESLTFDLLCAAAVLLVTVLILLSW